MICAPGFTMLAGQCVARAEPAPVAHTSDIGLWLGCIVLIVVAATAVIAWRSR